MEKINELKLEQKEIPPVTLEEFLTELNNENINTLPAEMIKNQLETTEESILTRDFNCGIRISRNELEEGDFEYKTWTTNNLEDPQHPLSRKFAHRKIIIE